MWLLMRRGVLWGLWVSIGFAMGVLGLIEIAAGGLVGLER